MAAPVYTPLVPNAVENVNTLNTILATLAASCGVGAIDSTQLAANAVTTAAITDAAVTSRKTQFDNCIAYRTTSLSLTGAAYSAVGMDAEVEDASGIHDTVTNNDRFTAVTAGLYLATFQCNSFSGVDSAPGGAGTAFVRGKIERFNSGSALQESAQNMGSLPLALRLGAFGSGVGGTGYNVTGVSYDNSLLLCVTTVMRMAVGDYLRGSIRYDGLGTISLAAGGGVSGNSMRVTKLSA